MSLAATLLALLSVTVVLSPRSPAVPAMPPAALIQTQTLSAPSALPVDTRLDRVLTLSARSMPLEDLLKKMSTGDLQLSADTSYISQRIQLRVKQRSLRALMQSLAQLLSGVWKLSADGSHYVLSMRTGTVRYRDTWWQLYNQDWERARAAQQAAVLRAMQTPPRIRKPEDPSPEHSDPQLEARVAAGAGFYNDLSPDLQQRIAASMSDLAQFLDYAPSRVNEGAVTVPITALPPQAQKLLLQDNPQFTQHFNLSPADITVRFNNHGFNVSTSLLAGGVATDTSIRLHIGAVPEAYVLPFDQRALPNLVRKLGNAAPEAWKRLAAYQQSRVWQNDPPASTNAITLRSYNRAEALQWLGEKGNIEFLADCYAAKGTPLSDEEKQRPLNQTPKEALDVFARDQDSSWRKASDGLYLIRNNRWYRDDYTQVPESLLKRWAAELKTQRMFWPKALQATAPSSSEMFKRQMEWEAEAVTTLSPWQIAYGLTWAAVEEDAPVPVEEKDGKIADVPSPAKTRQKKVTGFPFAVAAYVLLTERRTARFYADLDGGQREALLAGRLAVADLTPAQQAQLSSIMPSLSQAGPNQPLTYLGLEPDKSAVGYPVPGTINSIMTGMSARLVLMPAGSAFGLFGTEIK